MERIGRRGSRHPVHRRERIIRAGHTTLRANSLSCLGGNNSVLCFWAIRGFGTEAIGHRSSQQQVPPAAAVIAWRATLHTRRTFYSAAAQTPSLLLTHGCGARHSLPKCNHPSTRTGRAYSTPTVAWCP